MPTRRQEKVARVIKEVVSDVVANHLSDPRIEGFVSVTKVDVAVDLRSAHIYLSIFGGKSVLPGVHEQKTDQENAVQNKTFNAIVHAKSRIQSFLASRLKSKFCPVLHFHKDEQFKKTLETMRLIDQAVGDSEDEDLAEQH